MDVLKPVTIDELYITPFTARRVYDEDGVINWVPVERNLNPTGLRTVDFIARSFSAGQSDFKVMARQLGCSVQDLRGFLRTLTGMTADEFRNAYMFRLADDLLRYTAMTVDEVAKRSGLHSASQLCQQFMKHRKITAINRRLALRQPRDEGRYRV
jgi:AraC-like DNA-binding protein